MSSFFHGWRRKIGLLTLVLALLLTSGWLRSHSREDQFSFVAFQKYECFASTAGNLEWASWVRDDEFAKAPYPLQFWSRPIQDTTKHYQARTVNSLAGLIRACFVPAQSVPTPRPEALFERMSIGGGGNFGGVSDRVVRLVALPYLLIIWPLILFSANLLFLKPRSAMTFLRAFAAGKRRKVGIVTSAIALAIAGGWIRSFDQKDVTVFRGRSSHNRIVSMNGRIGWGTIHPKPNEDLSQYWQSTDLNRERELSPEVNRKLSFSDWTDWFHLNDADQANGRTYWGLRLAVDRDKVPGHTLKIWIIPYAFIVVPLLLLSVGLILSKRPST